MCNLQLEQIYFTYECYYCCCCCVAVWFFIYRVSYDTRWWYINWLRWLDANTQLGQTLISFQAEIKAKQLCFSKKTFPLQISTKISLNPLLKTFIIFKPRVTFTLYVYIIQLRKSPCWLKRLFIYIHQKVTGCGFLLIFCIKPS